MRLKFESHWARVAMDPRWGPLGPRSNFFRKFFDFFFVKWGPSQKIVAQIQRVFFVLEGVTLGLPQTSVPPPPWANPSYVPVHLCLRIIRRSVTELLLQSDSDSNFAPLPLGA